MTMHLGLYHEPIHTDGRSFDTYGPFARYVLEFTRHFDRVTVFAPTTDQPTYFSGHPLVAPNLTIVPLPFFQTHAQAYRRAPAIYRAFKSAADSLDAVECRATAPLAYALWWLTRKRPVPFIYHLASDPFDVIAHSPRYRGPKRFLARTAYSAEFALQKYIIRRNFAFIDGPAPQGRLRELLPNVEPLVHSVMQASDCYLRADSCTGPVTRLLYVGYLRDGKGLNYLLDALAILRSAGRNVELDLVGSGEMQDSLYRQAATAGLLPYVNFRGYAVMGPELNRYYDQADIFVLPSLSEGSPRVVAEAMGHSLPVVSTNVGNVRDLLDAGRRGIIVPPKDSAAIALAVGRFIYDPTFRRQCIADGYTFGREHTIETTVARIAAKFREMAQARQRSKA